MNPSSYNKSSDSNKRLKLGIRINRNKVPSRYSFIIIIIIIIIIISLLPQFVFLHLSTYYTRVVVFEEIKTNEIGVTHAV